MAMASGLALPGHMLMFGEVIDLFVAYDLSQTLLARIASQSAGIPGSNTSGPVPPMNTSLYFCDFTQTSQTTNVIRFLRANDTAAAQLQSDIGRFSIYYVALATALLITSFLATSLMNCAAYRQTKRMRLAFFRSILRQEIGWFDVNPTAELNNRLSE